MILALVNRKEEKVIIGNIQVLASSTFTFKDLGIVKSNLDNEIEKILKSQRPHIEGVISI